MRLPIRTLSLCVALACGCVSGCKRDVPTIEAELAVTGSPSRGMEGTSSKPSLEDSEGAASGDKKRGENADKVSDAPSPTGGASGASTQDAIGVPAGNEANTASPSRNADPKNEAFDPKKDPRIWDPENRDGIPAHPEHIPKDAEKVPPGQDPNWNEGSIPPGHRLPVWE